MKSGARILVFLIFLLLSASAVRLSASGSEAVPTVFFTSSSDFIRIGRLFEDANGDIRRIMRRDSGLVRPTAGLAVLTWEKCGAETPLDGDESVACTVLARRDGVIWCDTASALEELTCEEAVKIFSGKINDFSFAGLTAFTIARVTLRDGDAELHRPAGWLLDGTGSSLSPVRFEVGGPEEAEVLVAGNTHALGLSFFRGRPAEGVRPLRIGGLLPGEDGYLLAAEYRLYYRKSEAETWERIAKIFRENLNSPDIRDTYNAELGMTAVSEEHR